MKYKIIASLLFFSSLLGFFLRTIIPLFLNQRTMRPHCLEWFFLPGRRYSYDVFITAAIWVLGVGGISTYLITSFSIEDGKPLTTAGYVFGIVISFFTVYTFFKTRHIDYKMGCEITSFEELVDKVIFAMERLERKFGSAVYPPPSPPPIFRMVTFTASLGAISFDPSYSQFGNDNQHSGNTRYQKFMATLKRLKTMADNGRLNFGIICLSQQKRLELHERVRPDKFQILDNQTNLDLTLLTNGRNSYVTQVNFIPRNQFIIVDDIAYEFVLRETVGQGQQTRISGFRSERPLKIQALLDSFEFLGNQ